jgi:hypothetical protein
MKKITMIAGHFIHAGKTPALAQVAAPHDRQQQVRQHQVIQHQVRKQQRIVHGHSNKALSRTETRQLCKQQRRFKQHKRIARADGRVTIQERARINRHQRRASANIYRKKHNAVN